MGVIILVAGVSLEGIAQQQTFQIKGKVVDTRQQEPLPDVHIVNTLDKSVTNDSGHYQIKVKPGDPTAFTAIGYSMKRITLSRDQLRKDSVYKIGLPPKVYQLPTVEYKKGTPQLLETNREKAIEETEARLVEPGEIFTATPEGGELSGVFTYMYQNWSKKGRELQEYRQVLKEDRRQHKIQKKYSVRFVKKVTDIEQDKRAQVMMFYCNFPASFIINNSRYKIGEAIQKCFQDFKKVERKRTKKTDENFKGGWGNE